MRQPSVVQRPRVGSIVVLAFLSGIVSLYLGWTTRSLIASGQYSASMWTTAYAYGLLVLGVLLLIDAGLVAAYRRIGLVIGLIIYLLSTVINAINLYDDHTAPALNLSPLIASLVIGLAVLFFLCKYLLKKPEKTFFR